MEKGKRQMKGTARLLQKLTATAVSARMRTRMEISWTGSNFQGYNTNVFVCECKCEQTYLFEWHEASRKNNESKRYMQSAMSSIPKSHSGGTAKNFAWL